MASSRNYSFNDVRGLQLDGGVEGTPDTAQGNFPSQPLAVPVPGPVLVVPEH